MNAPLERKLMVAWLIKDVTLPVAEQVTVHMRWCGGQTTSSNVERPRPIALILKPRSEVPVHSLGNCAVSFSMMY
jgi:hypothetical protein